MGLFDFLREQVVVWVVVEVARVILAGFVIGTIWMVKALDLYR
jgi:hypothetical protein